MFTISTALKNIRRYPRKSALYFLICAVSVLTLQTYMAGIDRTEKQLLRLPDGIPISARVSNLDGSKYSGLQIQELTVDGLINSSYVRDLQLTAWLIGWVGSLRTDTNDFIFGHISGINTLAALEGLEPDSITWVPGYDAGFVNGDEMVCLMDTKTMERFGLTLGDSVPMGMGYYEYQSNGSVISYSLNVDDETRIVGTADLNAVVSSVLDMRVVIPFTTAREVFHRNGTEFSATAASFYVQDALRLNDFKKEMEAINLNNISLSGDVSMMVLANQGTALMLNDSAFISAATRLQESLSLLRGFLPLLAAALAAIGYFVSYLMIQTRSGEYAVLRLLGLGKRKSMALYFTEIAALTLGGSLLGVLISSAAGLGGIGVGVRVFLLFSVCFMLGGAIALWRLGRTNVMLALTQSN
jgi:hypothetical protein